MSGKRFVKDFRIAPGDHIRLTDFNPSYKGKYQKHEALERVEELREKMNDLQQRCSPNANAPCSSSFRPSMQAARTASSST